MLTSKLIATLCVLSQCNTLFRFFRYFSTKDPAARATVSRRYYAVADECANRSNKARTFCTDRRHLCQSDYISYTIDTEIVNCDMYWTFPLTNAKCHGISQATTTIHEMTHVNGLQEVSTDDFPGHYGWPALSTLPPEQAIMNGDNYGFYANGMTVSIPAESKSC
jgi:deuterolysin